MKAEQRAPERRKATYPNFLGPIPRRIDTSWVLVVALSLGCGSSSAPPDAGLVTLDGGAAIDGGTVIDGGALVDGGASIDAGTRDAGIADAGRDPGTPSTTYPAFTVDWPQLTGSAAGVVATPKFVAITYDGDALRTSVESFVSRIGTTAYWRATTAEYGVGAGTALTPIHLAESAPTALSDMDIQTFLAQKLRADGGSAWPAPDGNTLYLLFYPAMTTITTGGARSCFNFGAYHNAFRVGGVLVPYAVMPRCPGIARIPALATELQTLTGVTAHEMAEAVTNVNPQEPLGYFLPPPRQMAFVTFAGAEVGDMCEFSDAAWITDSELGATVQRSWSNAEALAGREPCVPAGSGAYFVAVPVAQDDVPINFAGVDFITKGVALRMGESKTLELRLVSSGDTAGPFTVTAKDRRAFFGSPRVLTFAFDRSQGVNGEKLYVTVTRVGSDPDFGGAIPFAIIATKGNVKNYWFSVAGNPAP